MKKFLFCITTFVGAFICMADANAETKIGTVSFKICVETSKVGKQEQAQFEVVKKQFEQTLEKKQKELNELAPKFSDEYLDSLTPEAEKELKEKFQLLSNELSQQQGQYYQTLDQSHYQIMQKIYEMIAKASQTVAKEKKLDLVLNDEVCFFKAESLDVSKDIVKKLDEMFDQAEKEKKN